MSHADWLQAVLNREAAIKANDADGFRIWRQVANDLAALKNEKPAPALVSAPVYESSV